MIFELLHQGEQNATTGKAICEALNMHPRELTATIERERRSGKPICASTDPKAPGYYIPAHRGEMERYCASLHHRAAEVNQTLQACLKTIETLPAPKDGAQDVQ